MADAASRPRRLCAVRARSTHSRLGRIGARLFDDGLRDNVLPSLRYGERVLLSQLLIPVDDLDEVRSLLLQSPEGPINAGPGSRLGDLGLDAEERLDGMTHATPPPAAPRACVSLSPYGIARAPIP